MTKSLKSKWLLYCLVQMELFKSASPSFISCPYQASDTNYQTHIPFKLRINNSRPAPFTRRIARTNSKRGFAFGGTSGHNGNNINPPPAMNRNTNEPFEIPIIGPLLNVQKPIIVGDSIWLDPPTPLQWKAVEASVTAQHGGTIMNWKSRTASEIDEMLPDTINLATITGSPLVAILHSDGKEYATIAAIEGMVANKDGSIDTSNTESFRESLASLGSPYYNDSSKIRLMAIGRAKLSHFTTKFVMDDSFTERLEYNEIGDSVSGTSEPLLVARMELLFDSNDEGEKNSSPVHALNRLSTFSQRVRFLQQDRQRIVRGLQAAQIRLEMAMSDWEDWDGIGSINSDSDSDDHSSALNQFLQDFDRSENPSVVPSHSLPLSPGSARCLDLDNYGLGTSSSAFVPLMSMTDVLTERLRDYYSPTRLESEEFEYETLSWCALLSLQSYLRSEEIHEALFICTNTCQRLEFISHAMIKHKMELSELAEAKTLELRNCGEECDLF